MKGCREYQQVLPCSQIKSVLGSGQGMTQGSNQEAKLSPRSQKLVGCRNPERELLQSHRGNRSKLDHPECPGNAGDPARSRSRTLQKGTET